MLWIETPTNPLLKIVDLEAIVDLARRKGLLTVCDNTFCSPYLQRPLELGVDIVVHSTTKYLNGHSDMVGGVAVVREEGEILDQLKFLQNAVGAISGPFDSFLALRGIKTLALRMERHSQNGMRIAEWLESRNDVRRVIYPGLASHPQHAIAKRQMSAFGGMISVELDRDLAATKQFLERTQLFTLAESLGGVESPDRASGADDARLHTARAARSDRHLGFVGKAVSRHRGRRRPRRRSGAGAGGMKR